MFRPVTLPQMLQLSMQSSMMLAEANMVIAMRLWGMAGVWRVAPSENTRMVQEKTDALQAASLAAGHAILAGKAPDTVALAALKPVRARTRSNVSRLAKRGPSILGYNSPGEA